MSRLILVLFALCVLMSTSVVNAQTSERQGEPGAEPSEDPRWSVGAGLGSPLLSFSTLDVSATGGNAGLAGLGSLGSLSSLRVTTFRVLFERQLSHSFALLWMGSGSYTSISSSAERAVDDADPFQQEPPVTLETRNGRWSVAGAFGGRWILNPGGVVEVSPYLLAVVGVASDEVKREDLDENNAVVTRTDTASGRGAALDFGMVVERELLAQLWLRLSLSLIVPSYSTSRGENEGTSGAPLETQSDRFDIQASPSPSLELRLLF